MESIRNFIQLTEKVGTAGQPKAAQFELIANADFRHVVNLAMPDHGDSIANEGQLVTELGMTYLHIPVPFDSPQPSQVTHFCRAMEALEGDRIFVHCIMNYRVSAFMYHYLNKVRGYSESDSSSPMFVRWKPNATWSGLLKWTAEDIGL